ncbi:hypothetical protein [Peribacillus frigoritolerans]
MPSICLALSLSPSIFLAAALSWMKCCILSLKNYIFDGDSYAEGEN